MDPFPASTQDLQLRFLKLLKPPIYTHLASKDSIPVFPKISPHRPQPSPYRTHPTLLCFEPLPKIAQSILPMILSACNKRPPAAKALQPGASLNPGLQRPLYIFRVTTPKPST